MLICATTVVCWQAKKADAAPRLLRHRLNVRSVTHELVLSRQVLIKGSAACIQIQGVTDAAGECAENERFVDTYCTSTPCR